MSDVAADLTVTGYVQGVGYRYYFYRHARNRQLTGWAKNAPDGSVLARVEGDRGLIEELIAQLRIGPSGASVADVIVRWDHFTGRYTSFDIVG